jgi:hypothetical protein
MNYFEELREKEICSIEAARNQHASGHIEVCDSFWPYVKNRRDQDRDKTLACYVEAIRQLLAAHQCVKPVFNPADEKLAAQLFREQVELKQIEHAVLLACARRYMTLLNGTGLGLISGLGYFSSVIEEVRALRIADGYWQHMASRVAQFEQQWVEGKSTRSPGASV